LLRAQRDKDKQQSERNDTNPAERFESFHMMPQGKETARGLPRAVSVSLIMDD
jgi:hypothetical protein